MSIGRIAHVGEINLDLSLSIPESGESLRRGRKGIFPLGLTEFHGSRETAPSRNINVAPNCVQKGNAALVTHPIVMAAYPTSRQGNCRFLLGELQGQAANISRFDPADFFGLLGCVLGKVLSELG
jgi:hypothetical protein